MKVSALLLLMFPTLAFAQTTNIQRTRVCDKNGNCAGITAGGLNVNATVNVGGTTDTVGSTATFNANSVCANVPITGEGGAGLNLASGTLAATLTPSISEDATPSGNSCSGGHYTASSFLNSAGSTTNTLVVTSPNAQTQLGIVVVGGTRCVQVCTTAYTSGSATGFLTSTFASSAAAAGGGGGTVTQGSAGSLGQSWFAQFTDTVHGPVAVKAASTGAAATDPSLVMQLSPNQPALTTPLNVGAAQTGTWTIQPGNTANTTPWLATINQGGNSATVTGSNALKVDNSAVTQPVSGTVAATQSGTWTMQPGNTANTTPWLTTISQGGNSATVTGANALKVDGSAVTQPVSGTVTANEGGAPWTVTGSGTVSSPASGTVSTVVPTQTSSTFTLGALNNNGTITLNGQTGAAFTLTSSTLVGTLTPLCVAGSQTAATQFYNPATNSFATTQVVASGSSYNLTVVPCGGYPTLEVNVSAYTSGSGTGTLYASTAAAPVEIANATAPGQQTMANSMPVVVASNQSAIPVSESGTWNVGLSSGSNTVGAVNQGTTNGTNAAAWWMQIGDTTNGPVAVKAASTATAAGDKALVVGGSPNSPFPIGATQAGTAATALVICDKTLAISSNALNGASQIVAGVSAKKVYTCGYWFVSSAAANVGLVEGTGTNCATGQTNTTGAGNFSANGGVSSGLTSFALPLTTTAADALCISTSASTNVQGWISYAQF